jgi:hypothetical protein
LSALSRALKQNYAGLSAMSCALKQNETETLDFSG